jgi:hypothetical protein
MISEIELSIMVTSMELGDVIIMYTPKQTEYVVITDTKIKQDDGTWKEGIVYALDTDRTQSYVRSVDQLKDFEWCRINY